MSHVVVLFVNATPIHSTQPGDAYVNLDGQIFHKKGNGLFPVSRTRTMPVLSQEAIEYVPIMPANTMRHVLRENILVPITQSLIEKGASLSAGAYAAMVCGNASGRPAGQVASFDEVRAIQDHVFLGLFGGGPRMIDGKLAVDNAWAITHSMLDLLPPVAKLYVNPETERCTTVMFKRRLDPLTNGIKTDLVEHLVSLEEVARYAEQEAQTQGDDDGEKEKHRGLKSFHAVEVVIPGVRWLWQIRSKIALTPAQLGAVLYGVSALHGRRIGGLSSLDCGRVLVKDVLLDGKSVWKVEDEAVSAEHIEPFLEALDGIDAQQFEQFVS